MTSKKISLILNFLILMFVFVSSQTALAADITNSQEQIRDVALSAASDAFWVSPVAFNIEIIEGCTFTDNLTIGNDGSDNISYTIRTRQGAGSQESIEGGKKVSALGEKDVVSNFNGHDFTVLQDKPHKPDKLIVRFARKNNGLMRTKDDKDKILKSLGGGNIKHEFRIVPGLSEVELPAGMTVKDALAKFNGAEGILYAEPDYEVAINSTLPNDTRFNDLWGMNNTGQSGGTVDADIDAPEAWDISTGSKDVVVAVIDTGIDYTHPDLAANMWVNQAEYNGTTGVDDDGNGYVDDIYGYDFCNNDGNPMDDHYHGTHCAGTIGAIGNNNLGVAGVCWNVRIMAVKFLNSSGSGYTSNAVKCVEYIALMGANLSSNSWGGGGYSQALKDAIDAAGAENMLFVAAAGNSSLNTDIQPNYPSCYDSNSLIAVMATDRYDSKSSFSNWGPTTVDLGAPGSEILSCQPGAKYQYLSGTSMATPHVAGACGLLWSMNLDMDNQEVKNILLQTVDGTLAGKCLSGGRLNIHNAILETRAPWIRIEPEEGTIGPGGTNNISVTFDSAGMVPGIYQAEIMIFSPTSPILTIPVTMTVKVDDLQVSPAEGFDSVGSEGGPFDPCSVTYTLHNNGTGYVNWTTNETADWLTVEPNAGILDPCGTIAVNVRISEQANLLDPNIYTQNLIFRNIDSNSTKPRLISLTVKPPDCFTELFGDTGADLKGLMLTFSPNGTIAYYEACRDKADEFPTDPNGGTFVALYDDDFAEVILPGDVNVLFYGQRYDRFYIGSNGYISFGTGDTEYSPSLENHFSKPRISGVFTDLTPPNNHCISYKMLDDRVAVTFENVLIFGDKNAIVSFQIEMFFVDGTIRITWLETANAACVAGLSRGRGLSPVFFEQSDLSKYPVCWPLGDFNRDYFVNFTDFAVLVTHWLDEDCNIPYWCDKCDIDFSSKVDLDDLGFFADNWLGGEGKWWLLPVSHWKFDEGSGNIAYDSVGDNDGTISGAQWTNGKINGALEFDGNEDYVQVASDPSLDSTTGTWCFWIKPTGNPGGSGSSPSGACLIFGRVNSSNSRSGAFISLLPHDTYGTISPNILNSATSVIAEDEVFFTPNVSYNSWAHVALVFESGNNAKLYINGVLAVDYTLGSFAFNGQVLRMATATDPYFFDYKGFIDDVRIYDRILSDEEIGDLSKSYKATCPDPNDEAIKVDPNIVLRWSKGKNAISHDVYFGVDYNDVNDANKFSDVYQGSFDVNSWDPCSLDFETTYYWRIDEYDGSNTHKGSVWSFTTKKTSIPNLISWWELDEGSGNIAYDSVGDNDGTISGAQWTNGKINGALEFDGNEDYVQVASDPSLDSTTGTWCFWIKPTGNPGGSGSSPSGACLIFGRVNSSNSRSGAFISLLPHDTYGTISPNILNSATSVIAEDEVFFTPNVSYNSWAHVALVFESGNNAKLYINGVLAVDYTLGSFAFNGQVLRMATAADPYFYDYKGFIDDVRIYNKILSNGEIWQLWYEGRDYKATCPNPDNGKINVDPNIILSWLPGKNAVSHDVYFGIDYNDVNDANHFSIEYKGSFDINNWDTGSLDFETTYYWRIDEYDGSNTHKGSVWSFTTRKASTPHLISWWKLDENSGSIVNDSAGSNSGTLSGNTVWRPSGGQINGALEFDGNEDYVQVASNSTLDSTTGTWCCWIKPTGNPGGSGSATSGACNILSRVNSSNSRSGAFISLLPHGTYGTIGPQILDSSSSVLTQNTLFFTPNVNYNSWSHVAFVFKAGNTAELYINGTLAVNYTVGSFAFNNQVLRMANATDLYFYDFKGLMDDVRIYNTVLSAQEIWQLYQNGLP